MCGFLAFSGLEPDLEYLDELIEQAGRRGPDGSGWAVHTARGWTVARDADVALADHKPPPEIAVASVIVAHARLATDGGADAAARTQPYQLGASVIAYNGSLPGRWPRGDTQVIADLVHRHGPVDGLHRFRDQAHALGAERQAVLVARPDALYTAQLHGRYGPMPLHVAERPEGVYVCSRPITGSRPIEADLARWGRHAPRPYPVLVGISPVDDDPDRIAFVGTRSGARLADLLDVRADLLDAAADTENLFAWMPAGVDPPAADWRAAADRIVEAHRERVIVACGALVGRHLGADVGRASLTRHGALVASVPHPSGRCRTWNDPGTAPRAAAVLAEARRLARSPETYDQRHVDQLDAAWRGAA